VNVRDKLYNDALAEAFKTLLIRHQADAPFDHFFMSIGDLRAAADQYSHWEDRYKEYNYNDLQDKLELFIVCLEDLDSLALLSNRDFKKFLAFLKANRHRRFFFFGDFRLTTATFSARMRDLETALNIHAVDASQISINEAGILHEMLRSTGMEISRSADKTLVHAWSYFRRLHQEERMGDILRGFAEKSEFEALAGRQKREKRILSSSAFEWVGMPRNFGRRTSGRPQALTELDALVGMAEVKSEIERLASHALISGQKAAAGLPVRSHNLSFLFLGNPGTGKTTVARILAQSLRELGVLKKGHLVPAHRGTLIAPYSGQTAPLVTEIFLSALDGVLFVDEAYALHTGSSHDDYGREALDTLTLLMSEYAGRIAVIFAGYPKEMENMLRSVNPGLRERFAQKILFDDYTEDELWEIFSNKLRSAQLVLKDDGVGFVRQAITRLYKNRNDRFANAREIDNLFQNLVSIQEARLASQVYRRLKTRASKLALLTRPDCEQLLKSERSQRAQEKRHPVGFRWNSDTDSRSEQRPVCKSLM
jgi:hypothetical protein